jgi:eukaryotic-like serine/threonine-protein kinase
VLPEDIGPYRILDKLGEGGMGEVYRARDTRLGRDVAIKVLPAAFTNDPDRLARFEREARTLAALNHPHIAAIYGIEEAKSGRALVLELVEGQTLGNRIAHGLKVSDALAIARQIVSALDAAHEKAVVHRDLKPGNIMLTKGGAVKVLDFGLAKFDEHTPSGDLTQSPTMTLSATREGVILGTAAYMSPEQTRGQAIDKRTDIWAFGSVLYELTYRWSNPQPADVRHQREGTRLARRRVRLSAMHHLGRDPNFWLTVKTRKKSQSLKLGPGELAVHL